MSGWQVLVETLGYVLLSGGAPVVRLRRGALPHVRGGDYGDNRHEE